nr:cytochrome P450 [Tanacetum cinerariifolium]
MFIEFLIQNQFFSYSIEEFAQILDIPYEGACVFTDKWSLDELAYGVLTDGQYQTNPPSPDDINLYIRNDREGQVTRFCHMRTIDVQDYQILTREILSTLKPLEEIIQENVFCLGVIGTMFPRVFVTCYIVFKEDDTTTPSPITKSYSSSPPNAPSKTTSTKDTSSTFGTTSSSFELKPQSSPPSSNDTPSPQPFNPFLDDIMDVPPRSSNLIPL